MSILATNLQCVRVMGSSIDFDILVFSALLGGSKLVPRMPKKKFAAMGPDAQDCFYTRGFSLLACILVTSLPCLLFLSFFMVEVGVARSHIQWLRPLATNGTKGTKGTARDSRLRLVCAYDLWSIHETI